MSVSLDKSETTELLPVDWCEIRPEYFKVWADLPLMAESFGITLSDHQLHALGHMLVSMDLIDSAVDREPIQAVRNQLCKSVLRWMNDEKDLCHLPEQLNEDRLGKLRETIRRQNIKTAFLAAAENVFRASERKRNSLSASELIRHLVDEGQAAAEMTIQILGSNTNAKLNRFLQRIMRIGTIVDTLLDADEDFQQGILPLLPGRFFRLRLKSAIASQLPGLILGSPDRPLLWRYCLSYTRTEVVPLDLARSKNGNEHVAQET
jgi:hypothetical protein